MALHELATNAAKHGALSNNDGRVEITWRLAPADTGEHLILDWRERDGPPVVKPTRKGFGSTVVVAMAEAKLDAKVQLAFAPTGLTWRLECPAAQALEGASVTMAAG
jgi:two-component sensor histidine kinase